MEENARPCERAQSCWWKIRMMSVIVKMVVIVMMVKMVALQETDEMEARYIYINTESPLTISALLNVPISLALPILSRRHHYHGRALVGHPVPHHNLVSDTPLPDADLQLYDDPHYLAEVARLRSYFMFLRVEEEACRQRLLCELATSPEEYYPASDILLKELRPRHGPVQEDERNRFWRYLRASRAGVTGQPSLCQELYPSCSLTVTQVLNTSILKVWQLVGRLLNINFTEY
ncbi:uncharacterized protein [Panulirus ornatus]|uniref:uncharacterized protein n=1 Tax=Panulirus ornatus TaxID=150431 RepID=UPI003A8585B0